MKDKDYKRFVLRRYKATRKGKQIDVYDAKIVYKGHRFRINGVPSDTTIKEVVTTIVNMVDNGIEKLPGRLI